VITYTATVIHLSEQQREVITTILARPIRRSLDKKTVKISTQNAISNSNEAAVTDEYLRTVEDCHAGRPTPRSIGQQIRGGSQRAISFTKPTLPRSAHRSANSSQRGRQTEQSRVAQCGPNRGRVADPRDSAETESGRRGGADLLKKIIVNKS